MPGPYWCRCLSARLSGWGVLMWPSRDRHGFFGLLGLRPRPVCVLSAVGQVECDFSMESWGVSLLASVAHSTVTCVSGCLCNWVFPLSWGPCPGCGWCLGVESMALRLQLCCPLPCVAGWPVVPVSLAVYCHGSAAVGLNTSLGASASPAKLDAVCLPYGASVHVVFVVRSFLLDLALGLWVSP